VLVVRSLLQGALVGAVLLGSLPLWSVPFGRGALPALVAAALSLEVAAQLVRGINLGQHAVGVFNIAMFVQRAALLAGVAALRLRGPLVITEVVAVWGASTFLSVCFSAASAWLRSPGAAIGLSAIVSGWGATFGRGGRAFVSVLVTLVLVRCDLWMLRPMVGAASVGQMSVAMNLAEWLWYVPTILGNLLF